MLNDIFSRFDHLCEYYDLSKFTTFDIHRCASAMLTDRLWLVHFYSLDKVKTIGDCYMITSIPSDKLEHDG